MRIEKTSSDGKLEGFAFRITGANGYDETFVTDENGEIHVELRVGDYTVSEVSNEASACLLYTSRSMAFWYPPLCGKNRAAGMKW